MSQWRIILAALVTAGIIATVALGCYGPLHVIQQFRIHSNPAAVYRYHRADLHQYAERWQAGEARPGSPIPKFLVDCGVTRVFLGDDRDGWIVIVFGFMPTDPVPELWFSPNGFGPFPPALESRKKHRRFRWEQLSRQWGACEWDD